MPRLIGMVFYGCDAGWGDRCALRAVSMLQVSCGKCSKKLRLNDELLGRRVRCPACRNVVVVPVSEPEGSELPFWMQAFLGACGLIAILVIASIWIGTTGSVLVALSLVGFSFAVVHRDRLHGLGCLVAATLKKRPEQVLNRPLVKAVDTFQERLDRTEAVPQQVASTERMSAMVEPVASSVRPQHKPTRASSQDREELVEIRTAASTASRNTVSPQQAQPRASWFRKPRKSDVRFYGPGTVIRLEGRTIESPLVYYVEGTLSAPTDASLIESGLTVSKHDRGYVSELPYWPTYRESTPEQRKRYLTWLTTGRCRTDVAVSYPFIYFYGLERRVLIDRRDHAEILREVLRLLPIYEGSRSFQRYGSAFIWTVIATSPEPLPEDLLREAIASTTYWNEDNLTVLLSHYFSNSHPIPPEVAFIAAEHDPRTPRSVVVRRHSDRFRELFVRRYTEKFMKGMLLRAAKNQKRFCYSPASATLGYDFYGSYSTPIELPNTLGISSQFKPLIEIWSSAIDDLKLFDRAHRKAAGEQMTAVMYESLPVELRGEDHPHFEKWYEIINRSVDQSGWSLVPVGELAAIRGIAIRAKLTKTQCEELLRAADSMELAIEPDFRLTGQTYRWNELVSIFPREESLDQQDNSYHAASILLRLGMTIAAADGEVVTSEISTVTTHLEERFQLTPQSSVRLEHLSHVLTRCPCDDTRIAKQIQHLPIGDREVIGAFLVAVAAADEIVTSEEVKALKKTFRNLGLSASTLDGLASGKVSVEGAPDSDSDQLVLDPDRIRHILAETERVADLLKSVMINDETSDEEDFPPNQVTAFRADQAAAATLSKRHLQPETSPSDSAAPNLVAASHPVLEGLQPRYHDFVKALITRPHWNSAEFESLARQHRLLPQGAVDSINEWSSDRFGDFLIESDENRVIVQLDLLPTE